MEDGISMSTHEAMQLLDRTMDRLRELEGEAGTTGAGIMKFLADWSDEEFMRFEMACNLVHAFTESMLMTTALLGLVRKMKAQGMRHDA